MTLTKADIAMHVMEKIPLKKGKKGRQQFLFPELDYEFLTRKRSTELVEALFEMVKKALE